ncbi:MAG: universal stress protein [Candidatus Gastranaerophilales bacterium]|nr:universal stress protein [Candidatus Gastranaerophilales bacterium]
MMSKLKVLITIDEPNMAMNIANTACSILDKNNSEITLLNVIETTSAEEMYFYKEPQKFIEHEAEKGDYAYIENFLESEGYNYKGFVYKEGNAAKIILDISDMENFDLIVLGSHNKQGLERFFLGSVSYKVSRLSKKSVMVIKSILPAKINSNSEYLVCFAVDGSDYSTYATENIGKFLDKGRSKINILNVTKPLQEIIPSEAYIYIDSPKIMEELNLVAQDILKEAAINVLKQRLTINKKYHLEGDPAQTIIDEADSNRCDMIIVGSHGQTGITDWLLGSVSAKIYNYSNLPVLIIKKP